MACTNKTNLLEIYKCNICGNIIEVLHTGAKALVCCKQPMDLITAKSEDKGLEKHLPVIEKTTHGINIKVGSVPHPMEEKHYIEWIEIAETNGKVLRKFLKPGEQAVVNFGITTTSDNVLVKSYCNLHGLWVNQK